MTKYSPLLSTHCSALNKNETKCETFNEEYFPTLPIFWLGIFLIFSNTKNIISKTVNVSTKNIFYNLQYNLQYQTNRALEEWPKPLPPKIDMFAVNQNWLNIAKGVHWVQFWRKKLTEQMLIQQRSIICQSWHLLINIIYSISDIQYIQWGSSIDPCCLLGTL